MKHFLCRIGLHWWQYVDTGWFRGDPFQYHRQRCKWCGIESYLDAQP